MAAMMDVFAAAGLVFASNRGWHVRTASRILAFAGGLFFLLIGLGSFTATHDLSGDESKKLWLGSLILCAVMADISSWFTNRGILISVQRGWANPFLALPAVNSWWTLVARRRDGSPVEDMALGKEDEEVASAPSWR